MASSKTELPDLGEVLAPLLQKVSPGEQPLVVALAERLAAERYRGWAEKAPAHREGLLACAAREEEIAGRVEALYPNLPTVLADINARLPGLPELNRSLFEPFSVEQQLVLQSRGERLGAATWRSFAKNESDPKRRQVFLDCAPLEEANAAFLESIARG